MFGKSSGAGENVSYGYKGAREIVL